VTVASDLHSAKQDWQSFSTPEGTQIAERFEHKSNAPLSMDERREPAANVTVERDSHFLKHFS
jgi:hypothetical protein